MRQLSARERKLTAVALLILVLVLIQMLVIGPIIAGFTARAEQRALLRATYARNERLIGTIPALRRRATLRQGALTRFALAAPSAALAGDQLKERLRIGFAAAGGQVIGIQDVAASGPQARAWIGGRIALAQLPQLLAGLQNAPPYLVLEGLKISADQSLAAGRLDTLDVRIEASIPYILATS